MSETQGVGVSGRKPYGGQPHKSHCTCWNELERLRTALAESLDALAPLQAEVDQLVAELKTAHVTLAETQQELQVMRQLAADFQRTVVKLAFEAERLGAERDGLSDENTRLARQHNVAVERMRIAEFRESELQKAIGLRAALDAAPSRAHTPTCQCHACLDTAGYRSYMAAAAEQERPAVYPGSDPT